MCHLISKIFALESTSISVISFKTLQKRRKITKRGKDVAYRVRIVGEGGKKGTNDARVEIKEGFSERKDSNCFPRINLSLPNIIVLYLLLNLMGKLFLKENMLG